MIDTSVKHRDVVGWEGLYMVSEDGRVYSKRAAKYLVADYSSGGYAKVTLSWGGTIRKRKPVHRLVAVAFIPNPRNCRTVNHISGVKGDNRVGNLEWSTHKEQMIHAARTGLLRPKTGEGNNNAKLTDEHVRAIRGKLLDDLGVTCAELGQVYSVSRATVRHILSGASRREGYTAEHAAQFASRKRQYGRPKKENVQK